MGFLTLQAAAAPVGLDAQSDWELRSGQDPANPQPGVIWFHGFESAAEVDAFRWSGGFGNDPDAIGDNEAPFPENTRWAAPGAAIVPGCTTGALEIEHHTVAVSAGTDTSEWWRPLGPLNSPGNGRASNDPAANNTIARTTWDSSDQGMMQFGYSNIGYFGHQDYHDSAFIGDEWWMQARMWIPSERFASDNDAGGKQFYWTRNTNSNTDQELVQESRDLDSGLAVLSLYTNQPEADPPQTGFGLERFSPGVSTHGDQPGIEGGLVGDGVCRFDDNGGRRANCFFFPLDQWFTILYHFVPGHHNQPDSTLQIWVQETPGGAIRKVWDQTGINMNWDVQNGHNSLIYSCYQNSFGGNEINTAFTQKITQIIFSTQTIPFPQV